MVNIILISFSFFLEKRGKKPHIAEVYDIANQEIEVTKQNKENKKHALKNK